MHEFNITNQHLFSFREVGLLIEYSYICGNKAEYLWGSSSWNRFRKNHSYLLNDMDEGIWIRYK